MSQEETSACVASYPMPVEAIGDPEGKRVPANLPAVVDAHVHLFPDRLFSAIWRWFEKYGWPIRYQLTTPQVIEFLLSRGVAHIVALHYAHKPGIARSMNAYIAEIVRTTPQVTGLATVMPGEEGARDILEEAFRLGLSGVKLHCHVQCMAPDAAELREVYEVAERYDKPVVIHAGREPSSSGYACDPRALCSADRLERVLREHPKLRICIPHLGADEFDAYERLLDRYDHLWLDTTMMLADYFPYRGAHRIISARPDRIMYGTDFPNLPYAWDRELTKLVGAGISEAALPMVLGKRPAISTEFPGT